MDSRTRIEDALRASPYAERAGVKDQPTLENMANLLGGLPVTQVTAPQASTLEVSFSRDLTPQEAFALATSLVPARPPTALNAWKQSGADLPRRALRRPPTYIHTCPGGARTQTATPRGAHRSTRACATTPG